MDEVIKQLLAEKGYKPEDEKYSEEKKRLTEFVEQRMAEAVVDAIVDPGRVEMLNEAIDREDYEGAKKIAEESDLETRVFEEVWKDIREEYLGEE